MGAIQNLKLKRFVDVVNLIEKLQKDRETPLWFRGCGKSNYKLLPALYRHPTITKIDELSELEANLITRFSQRSIPYHNRPLGDVWETLFFMQHHGIPTRLLDWTENPLIALYFAVMSAPSKVTARGLLRFTGTAAMWILDPVLWNRHSLKYQSYEGGVLVPGDDALKGYQQISSETQISSHPLALYGSHNSSRIVAQKGVFTIFGTSTMPMEREFVIRTFPNRSLMKLTFSPLDISGIRRSVLNNGITESVVFPDLEGLSKEIKRFFGFEETK